MTIELYLGFGAGLVVGAMLCAVVLSLYVIFVCEE